MNITPHVFNSEQSLHEAGAERVVELALEAIAARDAFYIALSGGNTPAGLYTQLARLPFASRVDWRRIHIYFGDERCVAPDHGDSNYRMARERLLDRVPTPAEQIHRIHGEAPAETAAREYARVVAKTVPMENGLPCFDLVLLGVGQDGHVASLFPDTDALGKRDHAAAVYVAKLDAWRVSLTLPVINNARHVLVLAAGAKKAGVVRDVLVASPGAPTLPAQLVHPSGDLEWYLDAESARFLDPRPEA